MPLALLRRLSSQTKSELAYGLGAAPFLVFFVLFYANAWVTEDAYITFRCIEQFIAGNGPRWNPHERVQTFTHPLWFFLLALLRLFSSELFLLSLGLSFALGLVGLAVLRACVSSPAKWLFLCAVLLSAKTFVDFSSSGLETPLTFLLLALFTAHLPAVFTPKASGTSTRPHLILYGLSALLLTCRHDLLTLILPALVLATRSQAGLALKDRLLPLLWGFAPFTLWTAFSLVYYGFPLPNTAYAKLHTGIATSKLLTQGFYYFVDALQKDPLCLGTIAVGTFLGLRSRERSQQALSLGILLNLAYVLWVGGDFMSGRFFANAFLIAAILVIQAPIWTSRTPYVLASLLLLANALPQAPWRAYQASANPEIERDIADERLFYLDCCSLRRYLTRNPSLPFPQHDFTAQGLAIAQSNDPVHIFANIGIAGYFAGLDKVIIDPLALSDAFLARLPAAEDWRIGHFIRPVPVAYVESVKLGRNVIAYEPHRELFEHIKLVTQGDLWTLDRWRAIVLLNWRYSRLMRF